MEKRAQGIRRIVFMGIKDTFHRKVFIECINKRLSKGKKLEKCLGFMILGYE